MIRSEYMVLLDSTIIVDCCDKRKEQLEREWNHVEVLISGENIGKISRHCGIKPCLRGRK